MSVGGTGQKTEGKRPGGKSTRGQKTRGKRPGAMYIYIYAYIHIT